MIDMKMSIMRGVIVGGSFGIFAAIFGITGHMLVSAIFGSITGGFAGYTAGKLAKKRQASSNGSDQKAE